MNDFSLMSKNAATDVEDGIAVGVALAIAAHERASTASDGTVSCRCAKYRFITTGEYKRHLIAAVTAAATERIEGKLALTADMPDSEDVAVVETLTSVREFADDGIA